MSDPSCFVKVKHETHQRETSRSHPTSIQCHVLRFPPPVRQELVEMAAGNPGDTTRTGKKEKKREKKKRERKREKESQVKR